MPFRFRFSSLLQQRQYLLREAQTALASAQYQHAQIRDHIQQVREQFRNEWADWEEKQNSGMEASHYLAFRNYLESLEQQLLVLEAELNKVSTEVTMRKGIVVERDTALKILQDLKEKDRESYRCFETRREQKQLDETAVFKDYRERKEDGKDQHEV